MAVSNTTSDQSIGPKMVDGLKRVFAIRESGVLLALVLIFVVMCLVSPAFWTPFNLTIILKQISVVAIVAMGQTLVSRERLTCLRRRSRGWWRW